MIHLIMMDNLSGPLAGPLYFVVTNLIPDLLHMFYRWAGILPPPGKEAGRPSTGHIPLGDAVEQISAEGARWRTAVGHGLREGASY